MSRAKVSVTPPGAKATTARTGRLGWACAHASRGTLGSTAATAARCRNLRRGSFIIYLGKVSADSAAAWYQDYLSLASTEKCHVGSWHEADISEQSLEPPSSPRTVKIKAALCHHRRPVPIRS